MPTCLELGYSAFDCLNISRAADWSSPVLFLVLLLLLAALSRP